MVRTPKNYLLLSLILIFSFVYRIALMLRETFPPGADIGLHNSVVYSITQSGNTNFLWNYFHMGGGSSVTFPGYHIFVSYVILLTGMTDYVAHAFVVSLFSSLIVLVAFLITRKVWNASAAIVVAFLVGVSRFDIEMLMWGGYPNVITLMLIPLAFYLFLEKDRFSLLPFLAVTSLISGAIFLTHSLSAAMFIAITVTTVIFATLFSQRGEKRKKSFFVWVLPLIAGAILILPFLFEVIPAYFGANADTFTGGVADIRQALLSTKVLPLDLVLPLFFCVFLFFLFSKRYIGKYLSVPALILGLWILVPAVLTQGYLVGLYTDYNRFMYFVILPVIMLIGLVIYHAAEFLAQMLSGLLSIVKDMPQVRVSKSKTLTRIMQHLTRKNMLTALLIGFLLYTFLAVPIFMVPSKGIDVQSFYQTMNEPEYEAIEWTQKNTPANSVFVTDALYGWWFSGFAKRPTISAVDPQYLTNAREFEPARAASNLLDTDYLVDNGLIQVREDGGYVARHNPEFLVKLNGTYFPYPFFNFDIAKTRVFFRVGSFPQEVISVELSNVPVTDMYIENRNGNVSIYVTMQNQFFIFSQVTTVLQGMRFANVSQSITAIDPEVSLDHVIFTLPTKGDFFFLDNYSSVGEFDKYVKVAGQIIPLKGQPTFINYTGYLQMDYNLAARSQAEMSVSVGLYEFRNEASPNLGAYSSWKDWNELCQKLLTDHLKSFTTSDPDSVTPLYVFDYRKALIDQNVSYVAVRDSEQIPRFAKDPAFSLVFINDNVAIFQVKK